MTKPFSGAAHPSPGKKQHRTPAATLEQGPAVISEEPIGEIPFWMAIEWWENGDKSMVVFFGPPYFRTKPEMWSLPLTHFNPTMTPCRILPNLGIFFFVLLSHLELTEFDPTAMETPTATSCRPGTRGRRPTLSATREALLRVSREGGSLAFRGDLSAWESFPYFSIWTTP